MLCRCRVCGGAVGANGQVGMCWLALERGRYSWSVLEPVRLVSHAALQGVGVSGALPPQGLRRVPVGCPTDAAHVFLFFS
jgi:hypothetical protein